MWCAPGAHVRCHPTPVFHSHSSHPTQVPAVRSSQQRLTQTPEDTPAIIKLNENLAACRPDRSHRVRAYCVRYASSRYM